MIILTAILGLIAGIGVFLVACQMMSTNLEAAGSTKLKNLFARASGSRWLGVGIGALGTAAIQSSGATTVMVIGFVNVGIMSLAQAATIIYGANIGTTITAQIVALGFTGNSALSSTAIFAAFAGIGAFIALFCKKEMWKRIGGILTGFGMLFVGLELMSDSMTDFAQMQAVKDFLASISNVFVLVLIGALFTAIIQSSSVMTSIAIAMVVTGLINLNQGIFLTMGSNIGSCMVAIIAGMTSGINAKRTSLIHLFFNCFGVIVFLLIALVLWMVSAGTLDFGVLFERMFPGLPQMQLAMFHTVFNTSTVLLIMPLTDLLVKAVTRIISEQPAGDEREDEPHFFFLDEKMLRTPIIAVRQVKLEIEHMASLAMHSYDIAIYTITSQDFEQVPEQEKLEKQLNFLNHHLVPYIVRLNELNLSEEDHRYLTSAIRSIADLERIGDYAENIIEYATMLRDAQESFSEDVKGEMEQLREAVFSLYQSVMKVYMEHSEVELQTANMLEDRVDDLTDEMEELHVTRLTTGEFTANVGTQYLETASDSERIADHLLNIARTIKDW